MNDFLDYDEETSLEEEDEPCEKCHQTLGTHGPYCKECTGDCNHVVLWTGPDRLSEDGGLRNPLFSFESLDELESGDWADDELDDEPEDGPIELLEKEFRGLVEDLAPWCESPDVLGIEDRVFKLDPETLGSLACRDPLEDGCAFFQYDCLGQKDMSYWLRDSSLNTWWAGYVSAGGAGNCSEVIICYSDTPQECAEYLTARATELIKPLEAVRKQVQKWPRPEA